MHQNTIEYVGKAAMQPKSCFLNLRYLMASLALIALPQPVLLAQTLERVTDSISPVPLGALRWEGHLGTRLDTLAHARILDAAAWNKFYPETENAFRQREDDEKYPKQGVWRGEFWGKYLFGAIAAQQYYHDTELKQRIAQAVQGLLATQEANGYLGTYQHSDFFGKPTWNIWCRKYTLWGLLGAQELLGNDNTTLQAASRFADHLMSEVGPGHAPISETGQFYGLPSTSILTPVVKLYRATGNPKYLDYARYITTQWSQHPAEPSDVLRKGLTGEPVHTWFATPAREWAKSYEFISCVEGMLELYRVTGDRDLLTAAENIHRQLVAWERSPVGTVSFNDKFVGARHLINTVAELCDAVYWNRLSFSLFRLTKNPAYLDEIERTLYNALLCGVKPDGTWGLRRLRMTHEHVPAHNHFLEHHQCCVDNLPRGWFQGVESTAFVDKEGLYLGLFNPAVGAVDLPGKGRVQLRIAGDFLADDAVQVSLAPAQPLEFTLFVRKPWWSTKTVTLVNGQAGAEGSDKSWLAIHRTWQKGDCVRIAFEMPVRAEFFDPGQPPPSDELVAWHVKEWASLGVIRLDTKTHKITQDKTVTTADALPQHRACVFFRGPLALARDARLGPVDFHAVLKSVPAVLSAGALRPIAAPAGIWKAYHLQLPSGEQLDLCDFSSAGNTWDTRSRFATWNLCAE